MRVVRDFRNRPWAHIVVLCACYVATAYAGLHLDAVGGYAAHFWPPSGLALAAVLLFGRAVWPGVLIGSILVNTFVAHGSFWVACGIAVGNTAEVLLGSYLLRRVDGFDMGLSRWSDIVYFLLFGAFVSTVVAATVGVSAVLLGGSIQPEDAFKTWLAWWTGDALGDIIFCPLVLVWFTQGELRVTWKSTLELMGIVGLFLALGFLIFFGVGATLTGTSPNIHIYSFLFFPLSLFVASRYGIRTLTAVLLLVAIMAIAGAVNEQGMFARRVFQESTLDLQVFIATLEVTILIVAANIFQRRRQEYNMHFLTDATRILNQSLLKYEQSLQKVANLAVSSGAASRFSDWCSVELLEPSSDEKPTWKNIVSAQSKSGMRPYFESIQHNLLNSLQLSDLPKIYPQIRVGKASVQLGNGTNRAGQVEDSDRVTAKAGIVVPLTTKGKTLGVMIFISARRGRSYDDMDVYLAEDLAKRAAQTIDHSLRFLEAQRDLRARDDFISIASHELKTPMTTLKLQLQMGKRQLQADSDDPEKNSLALRLMDESLRHANNLNNIVEDLLDVARMRNGLECLELQHASLSAILQQATTDLMPQFKAARCHLELDLFDELHGNWDEKKLNHAIINVLTNAAKYAPGNPVTIKTRRLDPQTAGVWIRDRGPGINPKSRAQIFERFERGIEREETRHSDGAPGGLGLGLFIAKTIVEAHQGSIQLNSKKGEGCEFFIKLPTFPLAG